jgi:hypothetical protein
MNKIALTAVGFGTAAMILAPHAAADSNSFVSPSHNINCEMDIGLTFCESTSPPQSVHMSADGPITTCAGPNCLGNPGIGTPTLGYGATNRVGGTFLCTSQTDGVSCSVASGHGFTISNTLIEQQ